MTSYYLGWKVISSTLAARETDHFFFRNHSMNVPKGKPCEFFEFTENLRSLIFVYRGVKFPARLEKYSKQNPSYVELSWGKELASEFDNCLNSADNLPVLYFQKIDKDQYGIYLCPGTKPKEFRLDYGDGYQDYTEGQLGRLITIQEWTYLLKDREVFRPKDLVMVKSLFTFQNHAAAVADLTDKTGELRGAYSAAAAYLGYRILDKLDLPRIHARHYDQSGWSIPFLGKQGSKDFCWKLRPELALALEQMQTEKTPEYFKKLKYNAGRHTITECLNDFFGCSYVSFTQVIYDPDEEFKVWFAQIARREGNQYISTSSMGWINVMTEDEELLYQNNKEQSERMAAEEKQKEKKYIVFTHDPDEDCWRYKGIYLSCGRDARMGYIHCRLGIGYSYEDGSADDVNQKYDRVLREGFKKEKLREGAVRDSSEKPKYSKTTATEYQRSEKVVQYAKAWANGICQLCGNPAPFADTSGEPYLEVHHIKWLSQGGGDTIYNTAVLCPNCHRKMHALNLPEDVEKLKASNAGK